MTKSSPAAADHWAVSTRAHGGIVTAGVTLPSIELSLLGIPPGFTPAEIQTWLRDLAGVAIETSRTDSGDRPIPPLLHHALTGLLFSQTELWSHTGHPLPCAAVFVQGPHGVGFGWVGRARVVLLVNGEPHEPQWVIVRDEAGQEAMSAALPADAHILLTLEYWPVEDTTTSAPATLDAEYGQSRADLPVGVSAEAAPATPAPAAISQPSKPEVMASPLERELDDVPASGVPVASQPPAAPVERMARAVDPLEETPSVPGIESLPTQQPGLAHDPSGMRLAGSESEQTLPSTRHPSSATFSMPRLPGATPSEPTIPGERRVSSLRDESEPPEEEERATSGEPGHPVGRWLARLVGGFTRKRADTEPDPAERGPSLASGRVSVRSSNTPARPAEPPRIEPAELAGPPLTRPDIEEPHALPPGAAGAPVLPKAPQRSGGKLAAAGLNEILGAASPPAAPSPPAGPRRLEGLTAMSSSASTAGGAPKPPRVAPEPPQGRKPPYPVLEVKPPASAHRGPIQIEREPVGADSSTFAIPRLPSLPPREAPVPPPRPGARAVPAPPATPPAATKPPGARQDPPRSSSGQRDPGVPEPPVEFLEQFAESMRAGPELEPAPPKPAPPAAAPPARSRPPQPGIRAAAATPPASATREKTGAAPARSGRGVIPSVPEKRTESATPARPPSTPASGGATPSGTTASGETEAEAPALRKPVLRAPSAASPVPIAESDVAALMRELPLPAVDMGGEGEIPDGMLVAQPSRPRPAGQRSSRLARGTWPELADVDSGPPPLWRRPWVIATFVAVLFGIGWIVGHSQAPDNDVHATPMSRVLRTVGLGGARFTANIDSDPPGAWIAIDGKDLGRQTPSTLELAPGEHAVTLSMPDLGQVQTKVTGRRGQKVKVNEALNGSLDVVSSDPSLPVQMSLDGSPQGYLPVHVTKLPPGLHELQFSGPRMQPWAQNVSVGIRKNSKVVSKAIVSPATGVVQVQAQINDENGAAPLSGASVYVDGDLRGTTPATIELPRGPHSLRVQFEGVVAPIQVIDLPGGNRRFATFQFGLDSDLPPLRLQGGAQGLLSRKPAVVSATLDGLEADDLREAWLHVRTPDGLWTRYEATIESGDHGAVLTVNFPATLFNGEERAIWYLSAATKQGDEFFTELQHSGR